MKVSLNWIKQFTDIDMSIDELVERIGAQLGAVEEVENLGAKYQGVVVAKVVSCVDHPNADRLHVCTIDDGGITPDVNRDQNGHVQVVCGAPNVREGITVAWLPPGSTVPESVGKEPFVLEARELRGVVSNGMLASPKELALGDSHDGILEIDKDAKPGTPFAEVYKLDDYIIDIENKMFTHRPDCFGALGVAREIAGITHKPFASPDWYTQDAVIGAKVADLPLTVINELPELVPRFSAVTMSNIEIKPSPIWLQVALAKLGQKSINIVVDLTNFYMQLTGQPLHAYDYDKVAALSQNGTAAIVVRNPRENEKIALLNGKTIDPRQEAIMIATDKQLIGVGGVMGGAETEVDDNTKNIILEAANFDMYSVRRTSMAHGLFTDAVTRFNKGQSPLQTVTVLAKIASDVAQLAGGKIASDLIDDNHVGERTSVHPPVPVTAEFINARLGLQLSADEMKQLLTNVECSVEVDSDKLIVTAPFWRTDIETREDVVEEIGRLYGFDKLPLELPQRSIKPAAKNDLMELKQHIRETLAKAGANEVLTYSFVHGDLLDKVGQDKSHAFKLGNALSPDLQYYRLSLIPSLLTNVHANIKAGYNEFALFELGKAHLIDQKSEDGLPREDELTALVVAAADKLQKSGAAFYAAKRYIEQLIPTELTYKPVPTDMQKYDITKPFDMNRTAFVYLGEAFLGIIGEFRGSVTRTLKLPKYCAGFELDTEALQKVLGTEPGYVPLLRFPTVRQDLTLRVAAEKPYAEVHEVVNKALSANAPEDSLIRLEPSGFYQSAEDSTHKNVTLRISVTGTNRTLTDKEVGQTVAAIAEAAKQQLEADQV
jgi:phenylalanyl-tRNA synthetase beta chain